MGVTISPNRCYIRLMAIRLNRTGGTPNDMLASKARL